MNGKKYCSFAARGNIEDIKGIYVFGDVFTNSVSLMRKLVIIFFSLLNIFEFSYTVKYEPAHKLFVLITSESSQDSHES